MSEEPINPNDTVSKITGQGPSPKAKLMTVTASTEGAVELRLILVVYVGLISARFRDLLVSCAVLFATSRSEY